jgi:KxxxW cyclic peptide radical SAM maturase
MDGNKKSEYQLSEKNSVIRFEYFGGLFYSKKTGFIELDTITTAFLFIIRETSNQRDIQGILDKIFNKPIHLEKYISFCKGEGLIREAIQNKKGKDKQIIRKIKSEINKVKNLKNLQYPLSLSLYPTFRCNQNCKFCFLEGDNKLEKVPKYWEKFIDLLDSYKLVNVDILGGEPLLYPGIFNILDSLDKKDINYVLITNGQLITEEVAKKLSRYKNLLVQISLHSLNQKKFRKLTNGDLKKVISSIQLLKKYGVNLKVHSLLLRENYAEIFQIMEFVKKNGIKKYSVGSFFPAGRGKREINNYYSQREINNLKNKFYSYWEKKYKNFFEFYFEGCLIFTDKKNRNLPKTALEKNLSGCEAQKRKLEILPDGSIYPCIFLLDKKFYGGNIFKKKLSKLWIKSQNLQKLKKFVNPDEYCRLCRYFSFCNGGCIGRTLIHFNKIDEGDFMCPIRKDLQQFKIRKVNEITPKIKKIILSAFKNTPFMKIPNFEKNICNGEGDMFSFYFKEKLIGFVQYSTQKDFIEIDTIAVTSKFQKKGFGSILLSSVISEAMKNKTKKIIVTTLKDYSVEKFYIKNGFDEYSIGYSIKFNQEDFQIISKLSENISKKTNLAFVYKKNIEKIKEQGIPFKIINAYQTFQLRL